MLCWVVRTSEMPHAPHDILPHPDAFGVPPIPSVGRGRAFAKLLVYASILLIPTMLALLYLTHSNHLPSDDGSGYLIDGHRIYQHFRNGGFWDGLRALYLVRGFRPILFDLFLTPFLFLSGGALYPAYAGVILFVIGYTTLYSFLLLKERLSPLSASIGAALPASLPVFLFLSVNFYPEIALPGLLVGTVYHLLKSNDFSRLKHVAFSGLLAGLALCIRVDQPLMMLLPVLAIAAGRLWRMKLVRAKDILPCCFVVLLAAAIYLANVLCEAGGGLSFPTSGTSGAAFFLQIVYRFLIIVTTTLALCIPVVFAIARKTASAAFSLLFFTLLICVIPLIWFFPFALNLFEWMYQATFGDVAQNSARTTEPFWTNAWALLDASGSFLLVATCGLAVFAVVIRVAQRKGVFAGNCERDSVGYLVLSASFPFAISLISTSLSPNFGAAGQGWRRLVGPFCFYLLAFAILGLQKGKHLAVRQCVALCLLLTQAAAITGKSVGIEIGITRARAFGGVLEKPNFLLPEPNQEVISTLDRLAKTEPVKVVGIEGYTDVSVGGVCLLAAIRSTPYQVGNNYIPTYAGPNEILEEARRWSHLVVSITPPTNGTKEGFERAVEDNRRHPDANSHRLADILGLLQSGELPKYGLQLIRTMVLGHSEVFFFRSLAYKGEGIPMIATPVGADPNNLAAARNGARAIATSNQTGFPVANLNDDTPAPWGSAEGQSDIYAGVVLPAAHIVREFQISVFSPSYQQHMRDISIVAADSEGAKGPVWQILRARIVGDSGFSKKITVPVMADGTVVNIEIDRADAAWKPHKIWGIVCYSASSGHIRNYLKGGTGIYIRELSMK